MPVRGFAIARQAARRFRRSATLAWRGRPHFRRVATFPSKRAGSFLCDGVARAQTARGKKRGNISRLFLASILWCTLKSSLPAGLLVPPQVTLAWNPGTDPNIAGYRIYYGTASRSYDCVLDTANTNVATVSGLTAGQSYYFALTTRTISGLESGYSDEIVYRTPSPGPVCQPLAMPGGRIGLVVKAPTGHSYDILATEDFVNWLAIGNATAGASGLLTFTDAGAPRYRYRFYQLHETTYIAPGSLPTFQISPAQDGGAQLEVEGQFGHTYGIVGTPDTTIWGFLGAVTLGSTGISNLTCAANPACPIFCYALLELPSEPVRSLIPCTFTALFPGETQVAFVGLAGKAYEILESDDFSTWAPLGRLAPETSGVVVFCDAFGITDGVRCYQVVEAY